MASDRMKKLKEQYERDSAHILVQECADKVVACALLCDDDILPPIVRVAVGNLREAKKLLANKDEGDK